VEEQERVEEQVEGHHKGFFQRMKEKLLRRESDPVRMGIEPIENFTTTSTGIGGNYNYIDGSAMGGAYASSYDTPPSSHSASYTPSLSSGLRIAGIGGDYSHSMTAGGRTRSRTQRRRKEKDDEMSKQQSTHTVAIAHTATDRHAHANATTNDKTVANTATANNQIHDTARDTVDHRSEYIDGECGL